MQIDRVLGNVGVLYVGEYDPEKHYEYLNCATHNGSSYTCVNPDGVTGIEPGTTDDWQLSAKKGDVGPVGPKPVNGVDYNTPEEKEEFKNDVVNKATEEVKGNIAAVETEAIENYNENATQKTTEYDTNASNKLKAYNDNTTTKLKEYNDNASSKVEEYNTNANTQTETFNTNASTKTTEFDTNATNKTNAFNENYDEKLADINEASTSIEQERVISDGKYARALKTPVTDVKSTQIYAENDVVDDLVINGVELTQETREGYNKFYLPQTSFDAIGLNVNIKNSNELTIKGIPTSTYFVKDFIGDDFKTIIENGKTYTILAIPNFRAETTRLAYYITWYNSDSEVVYRTSPTIWLNDGKAIKVFTPEFEQEISYFRLTLEGMIKDAEYDFDLRIMMVEGEYTEDNIPEFELYGASPSLDYPSEIQVVDEQNITINETNITIPLINSAIGQYTDTIDKESNVQNKVIQELTLTGSESDWGREDTAVGTRFFKPLQNSIISNANKAPYALCTHFKLANDGGTYNTIGNLFAIYTINTAGRIAFGSFTDISTVDEWKAKLKELYEAGTPVKVYYVAKTSKQEPLSEEVQTALSNFKLYKDLNNVAIDSGSMSFIYNKSLPKAIEEMQDEIQSKDTLIQNLTTRVEALEQAQIDNVTEDSGGN